MKSVFCLPVVAIALVTLLICSPQQLEALQNGTWVHFNRQAPTTDIRTLHLLADGTVWATTAAAFHEFDGERWHKHSYDTGRFGSTAPFFADSTGVFYFYKQSTKTVSAWDARHPESLVSEYVFENSVNKVDGAVQGDDGIYIFSKSNGLYRLHDGVLDSVRAGKTYSITVDHNDRLWAIHLDPDSTSYHLYMRDGGEWSIISSGNLPSITTTTVVAVAPDGAVWVNTEGRHSVFRDGVWTYYHADGDNRPVYIAFGADGSVWGMTNSSLYHRTDDGEGTWELTNQMSPIETHKTPYFFVSPSATEKYIYDNETVYRYDESAITPTHLYPWAPLPNPYDLGSDMVTSMAFTNDGILVCGHGDPYMINEDKENAGLSYFDGVTWHNSTFDEDNPEYRYPNVFAVKTIHDGSVMVAAEGSYSLNFDGMAWSFIDSLEYNEGPNWEVRKGLDYAEDSTDNLWVGTSYGLLQYIFPESHYDKKCILHLIGDDDITNTPISNMLDNLSINGTYIYMQDMVFRNIISYNFNPNNKKWTYYESISGSNVRDFIVRNREGNEPWIWTAMGDGIFMWNDDTSVQLTTASAQPIVLPNASLIAADDYGNIWASGYDNTGYLDEDGVWNRIDELSGMQANAFASHYDERVAINSMTIDVVDMQEIITSYDGVYLFMADATGVAEEKDNPGAFGLVTNYPNPFNASTTIAFELPESARTIIGIYSLTGQCVRTLADRRLPAGANQLVWDGRDDHGEQVASGMYLYRIMAGPTTLTGKMLLLK